MNAITKKIGIILLIAIGIFILCVVISSVKNKFASVDPSEKYEEVVSESDYEFFPDSLPKNAQNDEFYQSPGVWLARSKSYVKFETTEEYLAEYESLHGADVQKETSVDAWVERHIEDSKICEQISGDYLNRDNCDLYVKAEGFSIQGYAIDRDANEIFIFYDGFD